MNELITQLGVGGIFAILVVREIVPALKNNNAKKNCVTRNEFESHKKVVRYTDSCDQIVKRFDDRFDKIDDDLKELKTLIRNNDR